jgi:hypothetical protein
VCSECYSTSVIASVGSSSIVKEETNSMSYECDLNVAISRLLVRRNATCKEAECPRSFDFVVHGANTYVLFQRTLCARNNSR